jgi:cytochrome bd-type quinol oxidase subunit 2
MNRLREELRVMPKAGWVIAAAIYLGFGVLLSILLDRSPDSRQWPFWLKRLAIALAPLPLAIYALLIAYIYKDAQRRAMRHVMWTFLAILIPNAIGVILYFVLRDPVLKPCSSCGAMAKAGFSFCPNCGAAMGISCVKCGRSLEKEWANCAYCGERQPRAVP